MNLKNEFESIVEWAIERGITTNASTEMQFIKLQEEIGELAIGIIKRNKDEIQDAIGDCIVVLTILAKMYDMKIEDCINSAYAEIKNRKGKMNNGTFVKEQ